MPLINYQTMPTLVSHVINCLIKVQGHAWVEISPNCPQNIYNSILAAYSSLSIFSVLDDQNSAVSYHPPVASYKVEGHAFSPTPAKCACVEQVSLSPVQLCMRTMAFST